MAKKQNIKSASVFERSGIRAMRARAIEVLLYKDGAFAPHHSTIYRAQDKMGVTFGRIFYTFQANLIKLHVLVPIR